MLLTVNAGSSSIKYALYKCETPLKRHLKGVIERSDSLVPLFLEWLQTNRTASNLTAISHRLVHGGPHYSRSQLIDENMLNALEALVPIDEEHLKGQIALIKALQERYPSLPQIACFDTDFHSAMPHTSKLLPLPRRYFDKGVRRYGFHGLSYAYLMRNIATTLGHKAAQERIILAHLGNGSSLAAVDKGKSVDTTMSFTPTSGVLMSSRSGDLDPGLVQYLAITEGMDAAAFHEMVTFHSGLLGLSETSSDMRDLLTRKDTDARAEEAIASYCISVKKAIGSLAAALGGVDRLVFSGGIGENAGIVRTLICQGLAFLGIEIDEEKNKNHSPLISSEKSRVQVHVMATDEEQMLAQLALELLNEGLDR